MRLRTILLLVLLLLLAVPAVFVVGLWWIDRDVFRGLIARQVEQATGRHFALGELSLEPGLRPTLVLGQAALANAPWASSPDMVRLDRLELQLDLPSLLAGQPRIERLVLVRPVIRLERGPDGSGNWQLQPPAAAATPPDPQEPAPPASAGWLPGVGQLVVQDGLFVYRAGPQAPEAQLALPQATLAAPDPQGPLRLDLTAALNGVPLTAQGSAEPFAALPAGGPARLDLAARLAAVELKLDGTAGRSFDLHAALAAPELAPLAPALAPFGVPAERLAALAPVSVKAHAAGDPGRVTLDDLALGLAGSDLGGSATAELGGARPKLAAKLHGRLLDLDRLLPAEDGAPASAAKDAGDAGPLFPDTPLPLDGLRQADGRLELAIDELRVKGLAVHGLNAVAELADGRLRLDPLAAGLPGGTLTASLGLDAAGTPPALELTAAGRNLALGELTAALAGSPLLAAAADLKLSLQSEGASPKALAEQLGGRLTFLTGEGRLRIDLLDRIAQGLKQGLGTALGLTGDVVPLHCLALDTPIQRGVAAPDLVATLPLALLVGTGSVDLGRERLDLTLSPRANLAGVQLGVPVTLKGPLRQPAVGVDPAAAARDVVSALGGLVPKEIAGELGLGAEASDNPCLKAAGGILPEGAAKALGSSKEQLEKVGKGLLQNLLKGP